MRTQTALAPRDQQQRNAPASNTMELVRIKNAREARTPATSPERASFPSRSKIKLSNTTLKGSSRQGRSTQNDRDGAKRQDGRSDCTRPAG